MSLPKAFPFQLPQIKKSQIVHEGFVTIQCDELSLPGIPPYNYYTLIPKSSAVVVLAIQSDLKFILTREYRHPTKKILLSCAGGYMNSNELPVETAKRELLEETGYTADHFKLVGQAFPYPGLSEQLIYYVIAENAVKIREPELDPHEIVQTLLLSETELNHEISGGIALDGNLCTALFFYHQNNH